MTDNATNTDDHPWLRHASVSHIGMRRSMNQDALAIVLSTEQDWRRCGHLFVVADGMGAHAAGEEASRLAVSEVVKSFTDSCNQAPSSALLGAVESANREIHRRGQSATELYHMGTTCSTLAIVPEGALIAHVGDSRVYRLRQGLLEQLTFDHSLVWEMRAAGHIRKGDPGDHIVPRNVITRCLGPHAHVEIDLEGPIQVLAGDRFLLCSDGLSGKLSDAELGTLLGCLDPEIAAQCMLDIANLRGGNDNITLIIVGIEAPTQTQVPDEFRSGREVSASHKPATFTPLWWIVMGLSMFGIAIGLWWNEPLIFGPAAVIFLAVAALIAWMFYQTSSSVPEDHREGLAGKAPYAEVRCDVDKSFREGVIDSLLQSIDRWSLGTERAEPFKQRARQLHRVQEPERLCDELAVLARDLMTAIQIVDRPPDSTIDPR